MVANAASRANSKQTGHTISRSRSACTVNDWLCIQVRESIEASSCAIPFGDVVMMHAYLGPDPKTGQADRTGWGKASSKFFGTPDQPNKPSRTSIQISFGGGPNLIEIEVIAVRPHKD